MSIEAMKQALELALDALTNSQQHIDQYHPEWVTTRSHNRDAIHVCEQAIADADETIREMCALHNKIGYKQGYRAGQADGREEGRTQAEKQEPVAWWIPKAEQFCLPNANGERPFAKAWEPLYTTPYVPEGRQQRTWVGLTDTEKAELWEISRAALPRYMTYATLIEAKLKEKNT